MEPKRFCKYGHDTAICGRAKGRGCKECANIAARKRWQDNPAPRRAAMLKYRYGLTQPLVNSNSKCAICAGTEKLVVDHNHQTKEVRGVLCSKCNHAVGLLKDSSIVCRNAADYLEKHGCYSS